MRFVSFSRRMMAFLVFSLLGGCTMIPQYKRPVTPLAASFSGAEGQDEAGHLTPVRDIGWADFFTDPRLRGLIAIALRENRELHQAASAIVEAQGQYDVQHAGLFPHIGADGGAMYEGPSDQAGLSFAPGLDSGAGGQSPGTFRYYTGGIGFSSYEIDLFGRIRSLSRSAQELVLVQQANLQALRISLVSQVANAYFAWLADRETLDLTNDVLRAQEKTVRLARSRLAWGETDRLTVRQAETQLAQDGVFRADAEKELKQDENLITLLIGSPIPADLPAPRSLDEQMLMTSIPAGLPSDLLERRPDIVAAEHDLLSSNADIGAARAAFFPRITLTATDGVSSLQFHKLFTSAATTWGVSPEISVPLLNWGQNTGNLMAAKARRNGKVAAYEKTVQGAFREVSDCLVARQAYLDESARVRDLVTAAADGRHLSDLKFHAGQASYLTALIAQRDYLEAREWQVLVRMARYQNMVTIYRALGGGWSAHVPRLSNTSLASR